jgi:hypothetical protein
MEKFIDKMCVKIVYFGERRDFFKTYSTSGMHVEEDRKRTICSRIGGKEAIFFIVEPTRMISFVKSNKHG